MINPIDRAVGLFNPVGAVRRYQARQILHAIQNSGYSEGGASRSKKSMKGWKWRGGSVKEDIEDNLSILSQRGRSLYMTSPIARAALNRIQTNVVGQGLQMHASPTMDVLGLTQEEARLWARFWGREFSLWADSNLCDATGLNNFYELQQIALLAWLQSGDVFVLLPMDDMPGMPYSLNVHLIEADRVCNPPNVPLGTTIRNGVELSRTGRVVAYWIKNSHPLSPSGGNKDPESAKWTRVPVFGASGRRNILHLMACERPEQYRGVPFLAPVIECCHQISTYSKAELTAAVVASLFTVFIKTDTPDTPFGEDNEQNDQDPDSKDEYRLGSGAVVPLGQNETIDIANPGRPNAQFDAFINSVATQIGAALNVPAELLLLRFTSSYSASRASLLQAWIGFRMWRAWMVSDFCRPIAKELLIEAILLGRVKCPGFFDDPLKAAAWCAATWSGPSPGQIDPTREVSAAKMRVEECFSTRARETAELTGGDYEDNVAERAVEEQLRVAAALVVPAAPANEPIDHRKQQDLEE